MCMFIVRLEYKENVDIQLKTETKVRTLSIHYVSDVNKAISIKAKTKPLQEQDKSLTV